MAFSKSEVLQGTLDLLVLKTLDTMGPMHGFGIAMRIQQVSEDLLRLNQGTLYPALLRLEELATLRELARNANARIFLDFDRRDGLAEKAEG